MLAQEIRTHLETKLIPFWESLMDTTYGGYYGWLGYDLQLDPEAEKGCILNSRILWFFSSCLLTLKDDSLRPYADHAYRFLKEKCLDREYGGVFWSLTYDGMPKDTTKHTYNQAFAIYALTAYYEATGSREALGIAYDLYKIINGKCRDARGYMEAFTRDFQPESNEKLSENGVIAEKTMNTLLHVFEGFTNLYHVTKAEKVGDDLRFMLDLFADCVYNPDLGRQEVFFDGYWNSLLDLYSYGHDIETSWLIERGLEELKDERYTRKVTPIVRQLAENIYARAYKDHSVLTEAEDGVADTSRVWWVQAESIVGFINHWQADESREEYYRAAEDIWQYIQDYLVDPREGSEWFWRVHEDHTPFEEPIVEPWKCPYHNGRMCLEVIRRLG